MCIDPNNSLNFVTCTESKVTFWTVVANTTVKKTTCILQDTPTACAFYGGKGSSDLLVGTKKGSIGMVARQRYWHEFPRGVKNGMQINCLLVVETPEESLIITTSEDQMLVVWNSTFSETLRVNLSKDDHS